MGRSPCCDKNGLKKGPWTPEEDQKLTDYIQKNGYGNWRTLPKNAGLQRCGKSCRLRWTNYLKPDIKRGRFSFEEEETIIQLHSVLGNKWSAIAARLPGRTDNEIKNYWNTHIRKRLLRMGIDPVTHSPRLDLLDLSSLLNSQSLYNPSQMNISRLLGFQQRQHLQVNAELLRLATSLLSSHRQNHPNLLPQNFQESQLPPYVQPAQIQNQNEAQIQNQTEEIPSTTTCTTTLGAPCVPFSEEAQLVETTNVDQFSSDFTSFNSESFQLNNWQGNVTDENYIPLENYGYYGSDHPVVDTPPSDNTTYQSYNNFGLIAPGISNISTPSSSPTPLNSNSTYINSEDERESSCSRKFEIQDIFDVNELCNFSYLSS